jgi:hypothetical protein
MEELLRQEGIVNNQEIRERATGAGTGDIYFYIDKDIVDKLLEAKNEEVNQLREENKYLRDKIDQFMELFGKKG